MRMGLGGQADGEEEGRAFTPLDPLAPFRQRLSPPGQHKKDLMGCEFPPHPRERARILPTLSPPGELISLFPDTLIFPLAFHLILGHKESQSHPKCQPKFCLGCVGQSPGRKKMAPSAGWLKKGLAEEMGTESQGTDKGHGASNAERLPP